MLTGDELRLTTRIAHIRAEPSRPFGCRLQSLPANAQDVMRYWLRDDGGQCVKPAAGESTSYE